jgi:hypothetical protein
MIPRIRYFLAHGDWKFPAAALALIVLFFILVRYVHV